MEVKQSNSYKHILKYTWLLGGVQGLSVLIGLIRNKLVALLLGAGGLGLISLFNSTVKLMADSTNLGIGMSGVRKVAGHYEAGASQRMRHSVDVIRAWSLLTAFLGMFACIVCSPLLDTLSFSWGDHTLHYLLLSPIVFMLAIITGETAVLKGMRRLSSLAGITLWGVVLSLIVTVPIYYLWGESGIIPSLFIATAIQLVLTLRCSYRMYPLRFVFSRRLMRDGRDMVRLGMAFVFAGVLGSGTEFFIRSYLNHSFSLSLVGLYNAGYVLTMTFSGVMFTAVDSDFFPRLSSAENSVSRFNSTVNEQIEVSVLLIAPVLIIFILVQPVVLPLLYSEEFLPAVHMTQYMIVALFFRAVKLPVSYIPLAKGDSKVYLLMEGVYDVVLGGMMVLGVGYWQLTGAGMALLGAAVFDTVLLFGYMAWKYRYHPSLDMIRYVVCQLPCTIAAFAVIHYLDDVEYWMAGGVLFVCSTLISFFVLKQKTNMFSDIYAKMKKLWSR